MSTLTYRTCAPGDLAPGECTIRRTIDEHGEHLRLVICARNTDGQADLIGAPIAVRSGPTEMPRRTWGFGRTAPGIWQVSPSIDAGFWHETPAVVGVPPEIEAMLDGAQRAREVEDRAVIESQWDDAGKED